jgi:putative DNA primase/helicase
MNITNKSILHKDRALLIPYAVGGRRLGSVENKSGTFAEIVAEVLDPIESELTREEFAELSKKEKAIEKGLGGFWLRTSCLDGIRRNDHVEPGRMLVFDLDYLEARFTDFLHCVGLAALAGVAHFWHTSRSHKIDQPKVRLVVLLSRDVEAAEYEFVARLFAERIGLERCDAKGFRPAQMMFKPTTHKGEHDHFESDYVDGELLDVDSLINGHPVAIRSMPSTWPRLRNEEPLPNTHGRKAQHPLDKIGLVGAFCRAHSSISDEIDGGLLAEFYSGSVYSQGRIVRAEWIGGSGGEGVLVYDDVFIYSHHDSDPCGDGRVHNVWDAFRIHQFGHLDDESKKYTNPTSRPSWKAMAEFAANDEATKDQLLDELGRPALRSSSRRLGRSPRR